MLLIFVSTSRKENTAAPTAGKLARNKIRCLPSKPVVICEGTSFPLALKTAIEVAFAKASGIKASTLS